MSDRVLIPLGDGGWIAMSLAELTAARAAAAALGFGYDRAGADSQFDPGPLCTAEQLAEQLQVPRTRIEQATRDGQIPCVRIGRRIRYRRSEVETALASRDRK